MDMQNVIYAVAVLFIMGIVFAILLGVAAKVFAVEVDEPIPNGGWGTALMPPAAIWMRVSGSMTLTFWRWRSPWFPIR